MQRQECAMDADDFMQVSRAFRESMGRAATSTGGDAPTTNTNTDDAEEKEKAKEEKKLKAEAKKQEQLEKQSKMLEKIRAEQGPAAVQLEESKQSFGKTSREAEMLTEKISKEMQAVKVVEAIYYPRTNP